MISRITLCRSVWCFAVFRSSSPHLHSGSCSQLSLDLLNGHPNVYGLSDVFSLLITAARRWGYAQTAAFLAVQALSLVVDYLHLIVDLINVRGDAEPRLWVLSPHRPLEREGIRLHGFRVFALCSLLAMIRYRLLPSSSISCPIQPSDPRHCLRLGSAFRRG